MVSSKDFLFGGAEPRKDSAALSLHFPLSPHPPNSSSSLALQALDDSDVWGEVPLSAYPSFSFFAFASFGKGIWHTYWFTPGQEQVEVVVQSLGTDNVYPKSGQTVRVHYTCRVSRISVPTL